MRIRLWRVFRSGRRRESARHSSRTGFQYALCKFTRKRSAAEYLCIHYMSLPKNETSKAHCICNEQGNRSNRSHFTYGAQTYTGIYRFQGTRNTV